jgi:FAD/FMN-containing dehydrogenase
MNKKELTCYDTDASRLIGKAGKVVFPKTVEEVQQIIKNTDRDIVPRGAGTNLVGGCVPNDSVIVDMGKMEKVFKFNSAKKTVNVEAGITLNVLNEKLARVGFEFPIDSFNEGISTIGGMIALNVPGFSSMKYGRIRDWIDSIEFVDGRGELVKLGKSDLMDVCGMEGITGIITSAVLKIIPKVEKSASIFQSDELDEIFSVARRLKLEKDVLSLEFFPPKMSELLGLPAKYHIIIGFDSDKGKIKGEEYEIISKFKYKIYDALYSDEYYNSEDPKFFFDKLQEFILFLESNQIPYFGYLGVGIVHPFFKDNEKGKRKEVIDFIKKVRAKPSKYGIGLSRKELVDVFERKVIQRIKLRHDPFLKLNRGKVVDIDSSKRDFSKNNPSHLKPIEKNEFEEIKPLIGEQKGASEIFEELKTPVEKMDEFIEKAELMEEIAENDRPIKKDEELEAIKEKENKVKLDSEINERIRDYEQTFESELIDEKRKKVEDFALNINKERQMLSVDDVKQQKQGVELRGKVSEEEKKAIDKIMGNSFGFGKDNKKEDKEEKE